ncbi:16S rRNA (cytidine(1402)-2'-O)-methyltransferase [Thiohalobacter thiocyanaticus]|uniref:Ribosomal RNA small subunit methyltransferase I n=1 Tax=Thiohalobacter thiocyanaticus TaxID=585455 RepID=A0A426QLK9_9GAMM|nr:16S rRNA (cytidine(1402)-2'-O)-methyltransferase [Thiohalobacter thiocyanaticus]RRQ22651.1 16S rRNA (cytidine(1402)-2'-O)-methyltransferase [Thiohalobacter thiocyanaticus]
MDATGGVLYVVATPIGNLADMSRRAVEILQSVDLVAAEDTRHSLPLLQHYGIRTPLQSCHEHNEAQVSPRLVEQLRAGRRIALISDAGTPLVSDPGFALVRAAIAADIPVVPVPGPSALVAALSVAGLPTDRFRFEGFLPAKAGARAARLTALAGETATLVFYESSHRIQASLTDMAAAFGGERPAVVARELTKRFEQIERGSLGHLAQWIDADDNRRKGEFVVMVQGAEAAAGRDEAEIRRILGILLKHLPVKTAAAAAAEITGERRNALYQLALELGEG